MLRQVCSKAAPITGQLCILPKVADNGPGQSEYRSVVKEGQENGGKIGDGGLVRLDGSPVGCGLRSPRRFTARINVTKARKILGGNCRSGPEQRNGQNTRPQMDHTAPRLHRLVRRCHRTEHDCDKLWSTVELHSRYTMCAASCATSRYSSCKQCRIIGVILPLRPKVGNVTHLRLVMESEVVALGTPHGHFREKIAIRSAIMELTQSLLPTSIAPVPPPITP